MFWTTWVRGISKTMLVLEIIASVIGGFVCMSFGSDMVIIGFLILFGGVLFAFSSIAMIMMISEISISLNEIN
jgi:hypothetical protein